MKNYPQELKIKLLLWIVSAAMFMQMLDGSVLNTAIPSIAASFGENPLQMQSVIISYLLSVAIFLPLSGWLSDRFGIKKVFLFAVAGFTFGSLLCSMSNSLLSLSVSRALQGMGGAFLVPVGRLAVLKVYPRSRYVNVLSFMVLPALIGPLIGPVLGGFLVQYAGWHWIFLINIPIGICCFFAAAYLMPRIESEKKPAKFDFKGFLIFDFALILLFAVGSSERVMTGFSNGWFLLLALIFVCGYAVYSKKKKQDALFDPEMFKIPSFSLGIAGNLIIRLVGGALPYLAPLLFQTALGFSPSKAGAALIPMGIAAIFAKTFAANLILKFGYKKFLIANTLILSLFIAMPAFIDASTPYYLILILFAFIGLANSLQFTAINTLALIDVPNKFMSGANNVLSVSFQISMSLGVALAALLLKKIPHITESFALFSQNNGLGLLSSFRITYIIIGVLSASGALIFLFVPKTAGNNVKDADIY
ncbi:MAG: DHA2 family efflux MFS transporter permease subunit [Endomicrobium sp.]|jgi:EmrB/QacA subfamily drug resistance transporter|nr:DHA2 family efflux MFS transporter permease subunit [Endomicrobium sp.]